MEEMKQGQGEAGKQQEQLRLDQTGVETKYSNVLLVSSGPEEIVLTFGLRAGDESTVRVTDRVIATPKTAKRFAAVLGQSVRMYEERFGAIDTAPLAQKEAKK